MSVVMTNDDTGTTPQATPSIFAAHPYVMILIVVVVGFMIYQLILAKKNPAKPSTSTGSTNAPPVLDANGNPVPNAGLSTDANGNPIVYAATTDEFMNYNYSYDSNNTGQFAGNMGAITGGAGNTTGPVSTVTNNPPPVVNTGPPPSGDHGGDHGPPPHPTPQPRPVIKPPVVQKGSWTCRYTVVSGDTLSGIAQRYNTTWPSIYGHNTGTINAVAGLMHSIIPGGPWNNIRPGEALFVPCK